MSLVNRYLVLLARRRDGHVHREPLSEGALRALDDAITTCWEQLTDSGRAEIIERLGPGDRTPGAEVGL